MRYGKSFCQWFKEVARHIQRIGFSEQYANAQAVCVRGYYHDKHNFTNPAAAAKYTLRNVADIPRNMEQKYGI